MIIPIRCFTCGKTIADCYDYYVAESAKLELDLKNKQKDKDGTKDKDDKTKDKANHFDALQTGKLLDSMGFTRYCCRRHFITQVDMMEII